MFQERVVCLRSFVRALVLLGMLVATGLLRPWGGLAAARGANSSEPTPPESTSPDTTGRAVPFFERQDKSWEKVYEVGKAWYDQYETFEAKRNDVSLRAPFRLEITPELMKVTENARNRLPNVEVKAGVAWVPFKGQTTTVNWEFEIGGGVGGSGSMSNTGRPSRSEWDRWYSGRPYPYTGAGFDNDHLRYEFDIVADGEAFDEGINTVKVKLWGRTMVEVNYWNPLNWFGSPVEPKDFEQVISQSRDVTVEVPYLIRKDPNLDVVEQNHQADLTVRLWDKNLARQALGGNNQNYYEPKVRLQCADGLVPPDDGTSNSEKMVCSDRRVHVGPHPPERIHVLPDFDPISIVVKHIEWDLPENAGKVYQRSKSLRKTELWCLEPGTPSQPPPGEPPDAEPVPTPGGSKPYRNARTPAPAVEDPDFGLQPVIESGVLWEIVSLQHGLPVIARMIDTHHPDHSIPLALAAGDLVEYRYTLRDQFGRHFQASQVLPVPPADDLASPDDVVASPPVLQLVFQEQEPDPLPIVEVRAMDLAGLAFGESRAAAHVRVIDTMSGQVRVTDVEGFCAFPVPRHQRIRLVALDDQARFLPVDLPLSPQVLQGLVVRSSSDPSGLTDDRVYLWMSPSFQQGHLVSGVGRLLVAMGEIEPRIGAVSDLDLRVVLAADWRFASDEPIVPAAIQEWGARDRRGLGYLPAGFRFPTEGVPAGALERLIAEQVVRLRVLTADFHEHILDIPLVAEDQTTGAPEPTPSATGLEPPQPNPATGSASIRFALAASDRVRLGVYDIQGRLVRLLAEGAKAAGTHEAVWNTRDERGRPAASGIYFFRLQTERGTEVQRLLLVR